jgi:hypothetical protein
MLLVTYWLVPGSCRAAQCLSGIQLWRTLHTEVNASGTILVYKLHSDRLIVSILGMEIYSRWLTQQIFIFTFNSTPLRSYSSEDNSNITIKTSYDFNQGFPARAAMQGENLGDKTESVLRKMAAGRKCLNTTIHHPITSHKRKGKIILGGSMRLRPPDFQTKANECGKDVCITHWPP